MKSAQLIVLAAAALIAAGSPAKSPEAKALSKLNKRIDQEIDDCKSLLNGHRKVLFAELDLLDAIAAAGAADPSDAADLFDALESFQTSLRNAANGCSQALAQGAADLLLDYQTDTGESTFPRGFTYGDSVGLDAFSEQLAKVLAKQIAKARERLEVTTTKFAKKSGLGLVVTLVPPVFGTWPVAAGSLGIGPITTPTVDVLVSVSHLDMNNDGVIHAGGSANDQCDPLPLLIVNLGGASTMSVSPTSDHRWRITLTGRPEGNHGVGILFCFSTGPTARVGVR